MLICNYVYIQMLREYNADQLLKRYSGMIDFEHTSVHPNSVVIVQTHKNIHLRLMYR